MRLDIKLLKPSRLEFHIALTRVMVRSGPGSGWTAAELNYILEAHVVDGTLTTFGCVEWESEQFLGVMRARCYPFKLPKRRFHGVNPQVYISVYTIIYLSVHVLTSTY